MTKELCPHCGASMMVNRYTMNKTLVNALGKLSKSPGKKAGKIGFTKSEYSVFTKMKHWKLIDRLDDEGLWRVNERGRMFLAGKLSVAREIVYFRDELISESDDVTDIFSVFPTEESRKKYKEMMSAF